MSSFASFIVRVTVKSSESAPFHLSRKHSRSKTSRLIAIEPPQQKFEFRFGPRAEAIEAFQTDRISEANEGFGEMNQRYPVAAPVSWSSSGDRSCRSQPEAGRA